MNRTTIFVAAFAVLSFAISVSLVAREAIALPGVRSDVVTRAIGTGFTYQGYLENAGTPVTDVCDVTFRLFADQAATTQLGTEDEHDSLDITDGYFSAVVNTTGVFTAAAFTGDPRWIQVELAGCGGPGFTTLPTQPITPAPYAIFSSEAGNAANLGGFAASQYARYERIVIVSPGASDAAAGTALRAALADITDASASKRYLVFIEPGRYDVGSLGLAGKAFVDIQGSGRDATVIVGDRALLLTVVTPAEIRDLTVHNVSSFGGTSHTVYVGTGTERLRLSNVRIVSAAVQARAITVASSASLSMEHSVVDVVAVSGGRGLDAGATTNDVHILHSQITLTTAGSGSLKAVTGPSGGRLVIDSLGIKMTGTGVNTGSTGVETTADATAVLVDNTTIDLVTVGSSKGISVAGNAFVADSVVRLDGGDFLTGIELAGGTLRGVTVEVDGVAQASGVALKTTPVPSAPSLIVSDSTISATGTSDTYGLRLLVISDAGYLTKIERSRISGSVNSVRRFVSDRDVEISHSELHGPVFDNGLAFTCGYNLDESLQPLDATCK